MTSTRPVVIKKSDPGRIEIDWADGHTTRYSAAELRDLCPCAQCVDEVSGKKILDPSTIPPDLEQMEVRLVGNYAITVRFSDGHATGIFPFTYLRKNDPAVS